MDQPTLLSPAVPLASEASGWRLAITGHFVRAGRVGGAEPMLYNLLRGFAAAGTDTTLLCGSRQNLSPQIAANPGETVRIVEAGGTGNRFVAEQRACLAWRGQADAVLFPNYFLPPAVPRRLGRTGVVMHDFQYRHFPAHFSARKRAWLRLSQAFAMRRADRVIAISQFVCDDACRLFGRAAERHIRVIPNPITWDRFAAGADRPRPCARPYVLSVAAQYPHKNLETAIRAFAVVAKGNRDIQLVLCGQSYAALHGVANRGGEGCHGIAGLVQALGLSDRVQFTGFVDDAALGHWYRHAEMFVFPSLFEGFGMPPVEALGFGLPTLTSGTTALPEVTRGLAPSVQDPLSVAEWASAIANMLRDPARFRPAAKDVAALQAFYHPERIARAYMAALN